MNNKSLALLAFFTIALLLPFVNAVVPSERAVEVASAYLRTGEQASIVNRPFVVDNRQYFVVYFHPQTNQETRNLIVVVDAETGELVLDEKVLGKVYSFDAKLNFLQNFASEKKLSFAEIKTAIDNGASLRQQAQVTLDQVETNLDSLDENLATVQSLFSQFQLQVDRLQEQVDSGVEAQANFERDYSSQTFAVFVTHFNSSLKTLVTGVKAGEDYQKAVINKSNQLTQKGIEQNKFKPGLQSAFDVGLTTFPASAALESAFQSFLQIDSLQIQRQVNDSIQSYLYRKSKIDSDATVVEIQSDVEQILQNKATVQECTSTSNLEKQWQAVLLSQERNYFGAVNGNATLVRSELTKIKAAVERCNSVTPAPDATKKENYDWAIAVILLALVAFIAWKYFGKKKTGESEEAAEPMAQEPKRNLFGD